LCKLKEKIEKKEKKEIKIENIDFKIED